MYDVCERVRDVSIPVSKVDLRPDPAGITSLSDPELTTMSITCKRLQGWGDWYVTFGTARLSSASGSAAKRTGTAA